jgi:pyridoxamine 5'-phosphate oxidase family protein
VSRKTDALFSEPEVRYLKSQKLLRIATVSSKGQPDVVPVGFEFDNGYFWVGGRDPDIFDRSWKYLNVKNGNKMVALTIDDLDSTQSWKPRGIKVYGTAEVMQHDGRFGPGKYLRITPKISWAMGIDGLEPKPGDFRVKTVHAQG